MIHPTAQIHPDAQIDPSVEIGAWTIIGPHVKIAERCQIRSHVIIEGWTELGPDNVVFPFCSLGAIPQDLKYKGEPTRLTLGSKNVIREGVTMNLGTVGGGGVTAVGDECLIMAYTHLGHDCVIGNHCIIANYGGLAGHVILEDYVTVGGMCGISQFVRLGAYSYIGGQSGIEKDIPPFSVALGGRPCLLKGANIVGLKRRGFAVERIQKINEAIKFWSKSELTKEKCLVSMESQWSGVPEVQQLVQFIRSSEAGVVK